MMRIGNYIIRVPDGLEDNLENELTAGDWHDQWLEMADRDTLELRFLIGDLLGIDVGHVQVREAK